MADKARTPSADRHANRDLPSARRAPDQQQACDIGTRNDEHKADGAHQDKQRRAEVSSGHFVSEVSHVGAMIIFGTGVAQREALHDGIKISPRLRRGCSPLEEA